LLHDMGRGMLSFGGGYGSGPTPLAVARSQSTIDPPSSGPASPTEWRTTPLWGVASSAPYLHDGSAATLDQGHSLHGGEADKTTQRYTALSSGDRQALLAFLHSLVAPAERDRTDEQNGHRARGRHRSP